MTPPGARLLVPIAALLVATGCAAAPPQPIAAPPSAPSPSVPTPAADASQTVRIAYRGGTATGDTGTVAVRAGAPVRIEVTSDTADEVHLHGYDKEAAVPAGGTATLAFTADVPGEFELELHGSGDELATLQVR